MVGSVGKNEHEAKKWVDEYLPFKTPGFCHRYMHTYTRLLSTLFSTSKAGRHQPSSWIPTMPSILLATFLLLLKKKI